MSDFFLFKIAACQIARKYKILVHGPCHLHVKLYCTNPTKSFSLLEVFCLGKNCNKKK